MTSGNFSFDTIQNFDQHIRNSIPNYDLLFDAVVSVSKFFSDPEATMIDVGCSTGQMLDAMPHTGLKIGVDQSANLLPMVSDGSTMFKHSDIRDFNFLEYGKTCFVTSIFTLQFLPFNDRYKILVDIYQSLKAGGGFLWAEKVTCEHGDDQDLMTFAHYDFKRRSFSAEQILRKEEDLRGLMHCNTSNGNHQLARQAGFGDGLLVWKFFNFECYLYRKSFDR
jgi:tRNA (cmo5U34)-methyltransferase